MMSFERFRLEIQLGNAEMRNSEQIADALEATAKKLRGHQTAGKVLDVNGNDVGSYAVERVIEKPKRKAPEPEPKGVFGDEPWRMGSGVSDAGSRMR